MFAKFGLVQQRLGRDAVAGQEIQSLFQLAHVHTRKGGEDVGVLQVALDVIGLDAFANDLAAFLDKPGHKRRGVVTE